MNRDNQLMLEALQSKFLQPAGADTYVANQLQRILNELENMSSAIHLSKSSHLDQLLSRVRDAAEMLMSERGSGTSENAEDSAEDKMKDRENARDEKTRDAEVSAAFHYDPMPGLEKTAIKIKDLLQGAANDEVRTEHIIKMAQTILGDPKEHNAAEYRKMLDGLIVLLNRFIVVPMN
jgi:hypothetical protein